MPAFIYITLSIKLSLKYTDYNKLLKIILILFIFKKYGYNFLLTCKHTVFGYNTVLCKRHHNLNGENKEYDNPVTWASDRASDRALLIYLITK